MLARTLAVVGLVGGAVWAASKYLKSQNGAQALAGPGEEDKSLSSQNGSGRAANGAVAAPGSSRGQTGH